MGRPPAVLVSTVAVIALAWASRPATPSAGSVATATVTVRNALDTTRSAETVTLRAAELKAATGADDLARIHVRDEAAKQEVVSQAVDLDDNGTFDELVFQADFEAGARKTFTLSVGERAAHSRDQFKVYGRFVRERRDDFAWENDRVAHRMYGAALETYAREPLTSSGVDVWAKRTPRLVVNDWYLVDDYHHDNGDGADFYSVGRTRGCGGNSPWIDGKMFPSGNFRGSRVIANGPIRLMFELTYEPWDAGGLRISEVKRITLDAGQHFNRFESTYTVYAAPRALQHAAGIRRNAASEPARSADNSVLRTWDSFKGNGSLGCAVVMDPAAVVAAPDTETDYLVVARVPEKGPAVYYVGSAWDKAGTITSAATWDRYVADVAKRVRTPLEVTIGPGQ